MLILFLLACSADSINQDISQLKSIESQRNYDHYSIKLEDDESFSETVDPGLFYLDEIMRLTKDSCVDLTDTTCGHLDQSCLTNKTIRVGIDLSEQGIHTVIVKM